MIEKIILTDFRNFSSKTLKFPGNTTVIVGHNASGKTNILESLFLLSTGKSFKAKRELEMISYGQNLTRIRGDTLVSVDDGGVVGLEIMITNGDNGWPKKRLLVNGIPKRLVDFAGRFRTVLFGPWDMDLVTESPSIRRNFLDTVLFQIDREYRRSAISYEKGLRQRNRLLFRIREEAVPRSQLLFWNQLLIKNGNYITTKREELIEFINSQPGLNDEDFELEYDRSVISEGRLDQYKDEEVAAATTLVGPHRDDFVFQKLQNSLPRRSSTPRSLRLEEQADKTPKLQRRELAAFGSRGEQRMGVLWLKMAELNFIEVKTGERPTLLLDDIFSELDAKHRKVVGLLARNQQTIITTTENESIKGSDLEKIDLGV